jgi:hypothetical protein
MEESFLPSLSSDVAEFSYAVLCGGGVVTQHCNSPDLQPQFSD